MIEELWNTPLEKITSVLESNNIPVNKLNYLFFNQNNHDHFINYNKKNY